jgi:hypothetical protein
MNKQLIQRWLDQSCYDEQDQRELEDWCNVEKFAELIVRECIGIVKQRWINPDEDVIAEEIKQHFGVEE